MERHTWGEEKIAPRCGFPSLSLSDKQISHPISAPIPLPRLPSFPPGISFSISTVKYTQGFNIFYGPRRRSLFFTQEVWTFPVLSAALNLLIFLLTLLLTLRLIFSPNGLLLSASSPTSPLLCWNAPLPHSHISLTLLRMLIPTVTGSQSQKASTSRKLMAEVCLSEALCIITPWKDEIIKCVCMCVCECVCLLPFNCFPSNQRGHCQVADLLKAVISHLQSLPRLIHWCVILHLFFPSSFCVNSLPSLMGATSSPLRLCSFLAAWCLSTLSFFFFLLVPSFPSLDYQTFFSFLFRSSVFPIKCAGRKMDLTWFKLIKTLSSNATFLSNVFFFFFFWFITFKDYRPAMSWC